MKTSSNKSRSRPRGVRLPAKFAWLMSLSATDRNTFISELLAALARNGTKENASTLIEDWRATAEAIANPAIMTALRKARKTTYTDWRLAANGVIQFVRGTDYWSARDQRSRAINQ